VSTDDVLLAGLAAQDPNTRVVGEPFTEEPYGIATAKSDTDLVRFVNGVLDRMRHDGTWTRLYQKWLAGPLDAAALPPTPHYRD
jgi:polar amino acid transport system substrate-binding protein